MGYEPSGSFITSIGIELKLDTKTMFEWQNFSQKQIAVPPYKLILEFIHLRAQTSETSVAEGRKGTPANHPNHRLRLPHQKVTSLFGVPAPEVSIASYARTRNTSCTHARDSNLFLMNPRFLLSGLKTAVSTVFVWDTSQSNASR